MWAIKILVSGTLLYVLLTRVDLTRLWFTARTASLSWLAAALVLYLTMILISTWRWRLLLEAQHIHVSFSSLTTSYLVAAFFNNFLPSNIGGDVVRIRDTAAPAGSRTLAATVVLVDRGMGLMGLMFVAAVGTSLAAGMSERIGPLGPGILWTVLAITVATGAFAVMLPHGVGWLLRPLHALHQEWFEERINRLVDALRRFRDAPLALVSCLAGGVIVQLMLVAFFAAVAQGLHFHVPLAHLAIVVPITLIVQMVPLSVNGFGIREAAWGFYLTRLGLPLESALALSFIGAAIVMLFSMTGAIAYVARRPRHVQQRA